MNPKLTNLYNSYQDPTNMFKRDPRWFCHDLARKMFDGGLSVSNRIDYDACVQSIILILSCWNFASRKTKQLTHKSVHQVLTSTSDQIQTLKNTRLSCATVDEIDSAAKLFDIFRNQFDQTGASKALSIINPDLFPIWDTEVRRQLRNKGLKGIGNGKSKVEYRNFMVHMKDTLDYLITCKNIPAVGLLKKIDEFHYVKFVMPKWKRR
jgi:hypothetical protein